LAFAHANVAFANANTVMISAQAAFTVANAAFLHANAAFLAANNAGGATLGLAFDQANTARSHANTAHASANAGLLQANTARDHANTAHASANAGQSTANAAFNRANTANITADRAWNHANAAFLQANNAFANSSGATFNGFMIVSNNVSTQGLNVTSNVMSFGGAVRIVANGAATFIGTLNLTRNYTLAASAVAASDVDCLLANYFIKTISGATTFTFSNPPPTTRVFGFVLELTNGGSAVVSWPASVKWPSATAPTLTASGVDILTFITDDGGTIWRGLASMINSS
jgi:hypothetical protein